MSGWILAMSALAATAALGGVVYQLYVYLPRITGYVDIIAANETLDRIKVFLRHTKGHPVEMMEVGFVFPDVSYFKVAPDRSLTRLVLNPSSPLRSLSAGKTIEFYVSLDTMRRFLSVHAEHRQRFCCPPTHVRLTDTRGRTHDLVVPLIDTEVWRQRLGVFQD